MNKRLGFLLALLACSHLLSPEFALADEKGDRQPIADVEANDAAPAKPDPQPIANVEANDAAPAKQSEPPTAYPSPPSPAKSSGQPADGTEVDQGSAAVAADRTPAMRTVRPRRRTRASPPKRGSPTGTAAHEPASNVISVDLPHLLGTFILVSYDRRLLDRASLAFLAGAGETYWIGFGQSGGFKDSWFVGAQGRFFAAGSFEHGVFAGIEGGYSIQGSSTEKVTLGPLLGYRRILRTGLAFEGSAGLARNLSRDTWLPILHANLGFAF